MAPFAIEEVGGIRASKRGVPAWLIVFAVSVVSVAMWYLLSFSSTDYNGGYPKPEAPAGSVVEGAAGDGHGGGH